MVAGSVSNGKNVQRRKSRQNAAGGFCYGASHQSSSVKRFGSWYKGVNVGNCYVETLPEGDGHEGTSV